MGAELNLMLTCKEASRAIASEEVANTHWRKRLAVRLHLLVCRHCRRYARQVRAIGEAARELFRDSPTDPGSRERLRDSILDQIPDRDSADSEPRV